jgi:nitronate monooxygenase
MFVAGLEHPIVLAPLAGGPSTPRLAAAVSNAGGLGMLAFGYLSPDAAHEQLAELRELTDRPFGVNVFVPGEASPPETYEPYVERLRQTGIELGEPRFDDDGWDAKLALLREQPPAVVSFVFGCPTAEEVAMLKAAGAEVWVTVTGPDEARLAASRGAGGIVAQGAEAGGHRASFEDRPDMPLYGLLSLLQLVTEAVDLPVVATGGIATASGVAAVLAAGAVAAQVGTAFMLAPEAGTAPALREAIASDAPTQLTRAFTGRLARGIRNRFMEQHGDVAPTAYPEVHYLTAPLRAAARKAGDADSINLWAGEAHALARELPAAEITRMLAEGARRGA